MSFTFGSPLGSPPVDDGEGWAREVEERIEARRLEAERQAELRAQCNARNRRKRDRKRRRP